MNSKYMVFGRVGLEFQRGTVLELEGVTLGDLPRVPRVNAPTLETPEVKGSITFIDTVVEFHTNGWYVSPIAARDQDEAEQVTRESIEPALRTALSLLVGRPVIVQFHSVQVVGENQDWSPWASGRIQMPTYYEIKPDQLQSTFAAIQVNQTARAVMAHLQRAHDYLMAGQRFANDLVLESALLEYAKAIELMGGSSRFSNEQPDARMTSDTKGKAVARLKSQLDTSTEPSERVYKAIHRASDELKRADAAFRGLKLKRMAEVLQLGSKWEFDAVLLGQVRDRSLAHPGRRLDDKHRTLLAGSDSMGRPRAWSLVMECLAAFVDVEFASPKIPPAPQTLPAAFRADPV